MTMKTETVGVKRTQTIKSNYKYDDDGDLQYEYSESATNQSQVKKVPGAFEEGKVIHALNSSVPTVAEVDPSLRISEDKIDLVQKVDVKSDSPSEEMYDDNFEDTYGDPTPRE